MRESISGTDETTVDYLTCSEAKALGRTPKCIVLSQITELMVFSPSHWKILYYVLCVGYQNAWEEHWICSPPGQGLGLLAVINAFGSGTW